MAAACAVSALAADPKPMTTQKEKASYGIGMNVARRFKSDVIDLDLDAFTRGFRDVMSDAKPVLTEAEVREALVALQKEVEEKNAQRATTARKAGEEFLAANKKKEGVVTTSSGLQYKVLKEGTGPAPKASDTVKVHYRGTLTDGTEFDSSYKAGAPITFGLDQVIKGWTEGLLTMKVGGKSQLVIPPDLGYGEQGQGEIPPNSVLVFEVELLGIEPAEAK
jgi:FKBP-type peptidyl-prolyl cis-trans isomerase